MSNWLTPSTVATLAGAAVGTLGGVYSAARRLPTQPAPKTMPARANAASRLGRTALLDARRAADTHQPQYELDHRHEHVPVAHVAVPDAVADPLQEVADDECRDARGPLAEQQQDDAAPRCKRHPDEVQGPVSR